MSKETYHIIPNPHGGWSIKRGGATRAVKRFETKEDAVEYSRDLIAGQEVELFVHRKDGTVVARHSSAQTSHAPKG